MSWQSVVIIIAVIWAIVSLLGLAVWVVMFKWGGFSD